MFLLKGLSGLFFTVNMAMLGNYTVAGINLINFFRGIALASKNRKYDKLWMMLSVIAYLIGCALTFGKGSVAFGGAVMAMVLSVLTTLLQIIETFALWSRNGKLIRLMQLFVISPIWLFSNAASASIGGAVSEFASICSLVIAFARHGINGFEIEGKDGKALAETAVQQEKDEK